VILKLAVSAHIVSECRVRFETDDCDTYTRVLTTSSGYLDHKSVLESWVVTVARFVGVCREPRGTDIVRICYRVSRSKISAAIAALKEHELTSEIPAIAPIHGKHQISVSRLYTRHEAGGFLREEVTSGERDGKGWLFVLARHVCWVVVRSMIVCKGEVLN